MFPVKRLRGQYETPIHTVSYMIKRVMDFVDFKQDNLRVLDPAVGDGVFVSELIRQGCPPASIHAYDIDPNMTPQIEGVQFKHADFLKEKNGNFDVIIGNPPYKSKRQSDYIKKNQHYLETLFNPIGIQNMYSMFVFHALQQLKPNGVLCMIVQDSFLTNVYYKKFRQYLINEVNIEEITLAPRKLFHRTKADVRSAILVLTKKEPSSPAKLVDRLRNENYADVSENKVQYLDQNKFFDLPRYNFAINVPEELFRLFSPSTKRLEHVVDGGAGISTGNDKLFLRQLSELPKDERSDWIPFYKSGGLKDGWFYQPTVYIHKDWEKQAEEHKNFLVRNKQFYYREGITCSSMGVPFSAAYLPKGALFGVNTNLFVDGEEKLYYILGYLNSNLAKYLLRKILNRTNMVTTGYVKQLPYLEGDAGKKSEVANLARNIVQSKKENIFFDSAPLEKQINQHIYAIYGVSEEAQASIEEFCGDMFELL
ncbi:HsdM family class I SAM-dependent methyltransferase [Thalassobacillus hwangdonensis]|uniref:site-specific DNA-methyltransferase (adenine-specific) n=1 Tax=Thalassobacillus hwangdonensis TaxID=546108 RepID=A0ABW3L3H1_9BACI